MKKLTTLIISFLLLVSCVFCAPILTANTPKTAVATGKSIDVYFISGQSNAAGETHYDTVTNKKAVYDTGFENIYMHGWAMNAGSTKKGVQFSYPTLVKGGQGNNTGRMGPELGIADYLSTYYNKFTGKEAIIIKYACGAASLDGQPGTAWGNFCPPSKLSVSTVSGENLYYNMTNTVKEALKTLKNNGYTEVNYKGFFWSQGEAEIYSNSRASNYGSYLEALINDFRSDLYDLTLADFGVNLGATNLPFVISEISPYFNKSTVYTGQDNLVYSYTGGINTIVAGQRSVAKKMTNVYTLYTGDYILNQDQNPGCRDPYHYSGDDCLDIGQRAGKMMYEATATGLICTLAGDTDAETTVSAVESGDNYVVTWSDGGTYRKVKKVYFGSTDITNEVTGNTYTVAKSEVGDFEYFTVEYEKYKSLLTKNVDADVYVEYDVTNENEVYLNGTQIKFKPYWRPDSTKKDSYKLSNVSFNNTKIYKNAEGWYTIVIEEDSRIDIKISKFQAEHDGGMGVYEGTIPGEEPPAGDPITPPPSNPDNPPANPPINPENPDNGGNEGGCKSSITADSTILFIVSLVSLVVVFYFLKTNTKRGKY